MEIKYIVTDLNGTLIDAMPAYTRIFSDILRRRAGLDSPEIAKYSANAAGTPWDEQFAAVLEKNHLPKDAAAQMVDEFCSLADKEKYSLYPGAEDLLKFFREKGYKVYATSASGTGTMIRRIYEMGILPYVDFLLGFDVCKKSPKHIVMLAEKERLPLGDFTSHAVYFGDGPGDMRLAQAVGIFAVAVAQTVGRDRLLEAGADLVIDRIGEALSIDYERLERG